MQRHSTRPGCNRALFATSSSCPLRLSVWSRPIGPVIAPEHGKLGRRAGAGVHATRGRDDIAHGLSARVSVHAVVPASLGRSTFNLVLERSLASASGIGCVASTAAPYQNSSATTSFSNVECGIQEHDTESAGGNLLHEARQDEHVGRPAFCRRGGAPEAQAHSGARVSAERTQDSAGSGLDGLFLGRRFRRGALVQPQSRWIVHRGC